MNKKGNKQQHVRVIQVRGARIRTLRQQHGLSQSQLARGICTQATISLIEKQNKLPSMNTLLQLAKRLDVDIAELIDGQELGVRGAMREAEQAIQRRDFNHALAKLAQTGGEKIADTNDRRQYNYLAGVCELCGRHRAEEAIYHFMRVLAPGEGERSNMDSRAVLATLGLALAYAEQGKLEGCKVYLTEARHYQKALRLDQERNLEVQLVINLHGGKCALALGQYREALQAASDGIERAVASGRLYLLDELYALRAAAKHQLQQDDADDEHTATVLAQVLGNEQANGSPLAILNTKVATAP
ncbi:helix-turn-helix domain-containing protein [Lacticaseibacillus zhaodongensis]|uniref:helix-turn-helix domain-containing protein n=1 Tax=Lacticaseibacillus zhaodongensis TaxID=2668065 RepID=UPI0012D337C0|nr:helix-turn-helix transcriptional regulator [Lacticaseibacillus zhaodongensis]